MATKQETFTWLLIREIRSHIEHLAGDSNMPPEYRDAFYAASREIGRNAQRFVAQARRRVEWNTAIASHEEATSGR
jgi:hypothetical protein